MGTDISEFARVALVRDQVPNPYDQYVVADLLAPGETNNTPPFSDSEFDAVVICAALGPQDGDLSLDVVDAAIRFLRVGGLLAATVTETLKREEGSRYALFIESLAMEGQKQRFWEDMVQREKLEYGHRLNVKGEWIEYTAVVYEKVGAD